MLANYHTHTYRCGHAEGDEKEYIECVIRGGLQRLGCDAHRPEDVCDPASERTALALVDKYSLNLLDSLPLRLL